MTLKPERIDKLWPAPHMFVISIRPHRLIPLKQQLRGLARYVHSWKGVDGHRLNRRNLIKSDQMNSKSKLKRGEMGCFLSHKRIWQTVAKRKPHFAFVMEDDMRWTRGYVHARGAIARAVAQVSKADPNWDLLILGRNPRKRKNLERVGKDVVRTSDFWGMFAYLIRPKGARKLLLDSRTKGLLVPCDVLVSRMNKERVLRVYAMSPEACTYHTLYKSDTFPKI